MAEILHFVLEEGATGRIPVQEYIILSDCKQGSEEEEDNLQPYGGFRLDSRTNVDGDITSLPTNRALIALPI